MQVNNKNIFTNSIDFFDNMENNLSSNINYFNAEVVDYPENDLPGAIQFRIFNFDNSSGLEKENLFIAYPLNPNIFIKPVPYQFIKVINIQGGYYYTGLSKLSNNENGDFVFDYSNESELGTIDKPNSNNYKDLFAGNSQPKQSGQYDLKDFTKQEIPSIKENPGDVLINGLQNNNIILTYDKNGQPIISLVINRLDSNYDFQNFGFHLYGELDVDKELEYSVSKKDNIPTNEKTGNASILNAGKIRINTYDGSIVLTSHNKINLISNSDINIDNKTNVNINSPKINLGENANEPIVLGNQLKLLLEELIDEINKLTVLTPNGSSSIPVNRPQFTEIKRKLNKILSEQNKTK